VKPRNSKRSERNAMKAHILTLMVSFFLCVPAYAADAPPVDSGQEFPAWITSHFPPYDAKGKVDPFVSFIKVREYELMEAAKKAKIDKKAATPLETVDVRSLKLIGIINKVDGPSLAMVELPDGKGYLIRPGMTIGLYDGVVTTIGNEMLVVEEDVIDVFGEAKKRIINLRLRQEKE
jgi:type IV pilus assembly protein PilP